MSPLSAVETMASLSVGVIFLGVAFAVRSLGASLAYALLAGFIVVLSGAINEAYAFGGYPQNFSIAFGLVALVEAVRFAETSFSRHQIASAFFLAACAATHHMYFLVTIVAFCTVAVLALVSSSGPKRLPLAIGLGAIASLGAAVFIPSYLEMQQLGYSPPINPVRWDFEDALAYGLRPVPAFWLVVLAIGLGWLIANLRRRDDPRWWFTFSLACAPAIAFVSTGEPRLLPVLIIVGLCSVVWTLSDIEQWSFESKVACRLVLPVTALLMYPATADFSGSLASYYAVLNPSALETIDWLEHEPEPGGAAVASIRQGWPVGWWFAGLSDRRIYVQSDERWIAFPREVDESRLVDVLLYRSEDSLAACTAASSVGLSFLVFRQAEWQETAFWRDGHDPLYASIAFANQEYTVLKFQEGCVK